MPALPSIPNIWKAEYLLDVSTDVKAVCRLFWQWAGTTPTNAVAGLFATALYNSFVTQFNPQLSTTNAIRGVSVTDLTTPTSAFGEHLATTAGGLVGAPLSAGAAAMINLSIARRYRGGKPRIYLPLGNSTTLLNGQQWSAAFIAAVNNAMQLHYDDALAFASGGMTIGGLYSVSYYSGFTAVLNPVTGRTRDVPKVRAVAIAPDRVNTFSLNANVASQRRRNLHGT